MALPLSLLSMASRAGTGTGETVDALGHRSASLALVLAPATSGQAVSVVVETSDEEQVWLPASPDPVALTSTGVAAKKVVRLRGLSRYLRARYTADPGGVAFSLTGTGLQVFATRDDLTTMGWVPHGLEMFSDEDVDKALATHSDVAAGSLDGVGGILAPITGWGGDVTWAVVQLAVYDLYARKGFLDQIVIDRAALATKWLADVRAGKIKPVGLVGSEAPPTPEMPGVDAAWAYSDPPWGFR